MDLLTWLTSRGGIAHRADAAAHRHSPDHVRAAIRSGTVRRIRAQWIALPDAPADMVEAAASGGRITCISLARRRGWWIPEGADERLHLHVGTNSSSHGVDAVRHWNAPLLDRGQRMLTASVEDALAHIAHCFDAEEARSIWESAIKVEALDIESLRRVPWRDRRSKELALSVRGGSDSGLETIVVVRLSSWGVPVRQQVVLGGHAVDIVIGSHLIVQIDGFAYHSSSADRSRDVAHDAELRLRGYTVLRFTYAQIVHEWERVERIIGAAIVRGLHLSPRERARRA